MLDALRDQRLTKETTNIKQASEQINEVKKKKMQIHGRQCRCRLTRTHSIANHSGERENATGRGKLPPAHFIAQFKHVPMICALTRRLIKCDYM